jgi:hypothetical protein
MLNYKGHVHPVPEDAASNSGSVGTSGVTSLNHLKRFASIYTQDISM